MRTLRITALLIAAVVVACSAEKNTFSNGSGGNASPSVTTDDSTGTSLGGNFSTGAGGGEETFGCSADLRYVVDGEGGVAKDCWPNQGCSAGECVDPCQAAADSKGNIGCEFVLSTPHFYVGIQPPCFTAFVANAWPRSAKLAVSRAGQSYDATQFGRIAQADPNVAGWATIPATGVPESKVGVLFLSHDPSSVNGGPLTCPVAPALSQDGGSAVAGSGVGQAWKIVSDTPISLYDILPYGGAKSYLPSAEVVLPTTAWGTNYIAVLPKDSQGPPWGQLVAAENNTAIELLATTALPQAGQVPGANPNGTIAFTLNAGEYVQWQLPADMTGSIIKSDKPVSFTGGNAYICYTSATSSGGGCDSAHQMIPPIAAMGSDYVMMPFTNRGPIPESIPYRIVGAVGGTALSYDPAAPPGAPTSLAQGQKFDFEAVGALGVKSQDKDHPFYLGQMMTGCFAGGAECLGDEEFVNLLPPAQFLRKYVFFTDPTYPTTNLVVVRVKDNGFKDVLLDCAGKLSNWKPVGLSGNYELTNIDLIRNGQPNGNCNNGPHVAESEGRFGVMVWGLDNASSYGYPAGGSVAPINNVVILPTPK